MLKERQATAISHTIRSRPCRSIDVLDVDSILEVLDNLPTFVFGDMVKRKYLKNIHAAWNRVSGEFCSWSRRSENTGGQLLESAVLVVELVVELPNDDRRVDSLLGVGCSGASGSTCQKC